MLIVHVFVHVKNDQIDAFKQATLENAQNSVNEPGIARFDIIQETTDPSKFVLVEIYKDDLATVAHKETAHYLKWRDTVASMMASPRTNIKYTNLYPDDNGF